MNNENIIKYLKKMIENGQNLRYIVKEGENLYFSPNCCHIKNSNEEHPLLKEGGTFHKCKKCGTVYKVSNPSNKIEDIKVFIVEDRRTKEAIEIFERQNRKLQNLINQKEKRK